jgi:hypothetical protein
MDQPEIVPLVDAHMEGVKDVARDEEAISSRGERAAQSPDSRTVRQAIVFVHGMGEQRPLQALNQFITAALERDPQRDEDRQFYSRPDTVTDSYESRVYLAPRAPKNSEPEIRAQTDFYEYHWAHLMQGNRLDDMWPTFRRMMLRLPNKVPSGLRVLWGAFWLALAAVGFFLWRGDIKLNLEELGVGGLIRALIGGGITGIALTYLFARLLPGWITTSFVDVVRYLDTSPRSYEVRREIRKGMVELLVKLHQAKIYRQPRYQRIIVVAHSLGAFIAYDGISYLWSHLDELVPAKRRGEGAPDGLHELEGLASDLPDQTFTTQNPHLGDDKVLPYQEAQRRLWLGIRAQGNPWVITDFVSLGTPMYFTDRLFTRNAKEFAKLIRRGELPTCPPQPEGDPNDDGHATRLWFSWPHHGRQELDHKAAFAVVRWTNMWFPARWGFFGDWFGERLAPLFGNGIRDIELNGNGLRARAPGYAHAQYLKFPTDTTELSVTTRLRETLDFASSEWLRGTLPRIEAQRLIEER